MVWGNETGLKREQIFVNDGISAAEAFPWGRGPGQPWDNRLRENSPKAELEAILFIDSMVTYNFYTTPGRYLGGIALAPDVAWWTSRAASLLLTGWRNLLLPGWENLAVDRVGETDWVGEIRRNPGCRPGGRNFCRRLGART